MSKKEREKFILQLREMIHNWRMKITSSDFGEKAQKNVVKKLHELETTIDCFEQKAEREYHEKITSLMREIKSLIKQD